MANLLYKDCLIAFYARRFLRYPNIICWWKLS